MRINGSQLDALTRRTDPASDQTLSSTNSGVDEDMIYYLKLSKPFFKDIAISGPFYPLNTIVPNIKTKLSGEGCDITGSLAAFEEVFVKPGPNAIAAFEHFDAQLPDGNILHILLLKHKNEAVARRLRQKRDNERVKIWNVITAEPDTAELLAQSTARANLGQDAQHPLIKPMKQMNIKNAFLSKDDAEACGKRLLKNFKQEAGAGAHTAWDETERGYDGQVIGQGWPPLANCVMVVWDDCSIIQRPTSDSPDYNPYA